MQSPVSLVTSQCANPQCATPLRYLRDGRLFQFEVMLTNSHLSAGSQAALARRVARRVFHYWLCGQCCSNLTLVFDTLKGVIVKPRPAA